MPSQAKEVIESLPTVFLPEKAGDIKALVQFTFTGDGGGTWALEVADGQCKVSEETASQPDVSLTMDASDFVALVKGQLNPVQAFMGGKIKVTGNVGLVMQLLNWFKF